MHVVEIGCPSRESACRRSGPAQGREALFSGRIFQKISLSAPNSHPATGASLDNLLFTNTPYLTPHTFKMRVVLVSGGVISGVGKGRFSVSCGLGFERWTLALAGL